MKRYLNDDTKDDTPEEPSKPRDIRPSLPRRHGNRRRKRNTSYITDYEETKRRVAMIVRRNDMIIEDRIVMKAATKAVETYMRNIVKRLLKTYQLKSHHSFGYMRQKRAFNKMAVPSQLSNQRWKFLTDMEKRRAKYEHNKNAEAERMRLERLKKKKGPMDAATEKAMLAAEEEKKLRSENEEVLNFVGGSSVSFKQQPVERVPDPLAKKPKRITVTLEILMFYLKDFGDYRHRHLVHKIALMMDSSRKGQEQRQVVGPGVQVQPLGKAKVETQKGKVTAKQVVQQGQTEAKVAQEKKVNPVVIDLTTITPTVSGQLKM